MKTLPLCVLVVCWITALSAGGQEPVVAETAAADNACIEEVLNVDVKDIMHGGLYCLSFRKPAAAQLQAQSS